MSGYQRRDHGGGSRYAGNRSDDGYYGSDSRRNGSGGQPRGYRPSNPRSQVVSPWESGMAPMAGGMNRQAVGSSYMHSSGGGGGGRLSQDIVNSISQLKQMGNPESHLALNVINAVLSSSGMDSSADQGWGGGPRPNKMRRVDWGDGYEGQHGWMGLPGMQHSSQSRGQGQQHRGYSGNAYSKKMNTAKRNPGAQQKKKPTASGAGKTTGKPQDKDQKKKSNGSAGDGGKTSVKDQQKKTDAATDKVKDDTTARDEKKKEDEEEEKTAGANDKSKENKREIKEDDTDDKKSDPEEIKKENKDDSDAEEKENKNDNGEKESKTGSEEKENKNDASTKSGVASKESDSDSEIHIPPEALSCHICMRNFKTLNGFQSHVNGKLHDKIYKVYMQKCNAMLNVVKAHSKLDSQRKIVSLRNVQGKITACHKCSCPIKGGMAAHAAMRQHSLVCNFNNCSICKKKFTSRMKLENHRLTLPHLKRLYELKKMNEEKALEKVKKCVNKYDFPELEVARRTHEEVERAKLDNFRTQVFTPGSIPAYDPSVAIGMNFLEKVSQLYCRICSKRILQTAKGALAHFRSERHYENYITYLKKKEGKDAKYENEVNKKDEEKVNEQKDEKDEVLPEGDEKMEEGEGKHEDEEKEGGHEKEKEDVEVQGDEEQEEDADYNSRDEPGLSELTEVGESFISLGEIVASSAESPEDPMDEDKKPIDEQLREKYLSSDVEASTTPAVNESDPQSAKKEDDIPSQMEQDSDIATAGEATDSSIPPKKEPGAPSPKKPSESKTSTSTSVRRRAVKRGLAATEDGKTDDPETVTIEDSSGEEAEPVPSTPRTSARRGRGRGRAAKN